MISNSKKAKGRRSLSERNRFDKTFSMIRTNRHMIRINKTVSHQIERTLDSHQEDLDEIRHGNIDILELVKNYMKRDWLCFKIITFFYVFAVIYHLIFKT